MIALKINDIKNFMARLLIKNDFDEYIVEKAEVLTAFEMVVSGRRNAGWYDTDVWEEMRRQQAEEAAWMTWGEMKFVVFDFIKGKQTPAHMKISFRLTKRLAQKLLEESGLVGLYQKEQPELLFQVRYERGELYVVTGIAFSQFTLDKTLERAWDDAMTVCFQKKGISYEKQNE